MLTQGKDDDKEKWQNSRREACYTLSIEGILFYMGLILRFERKLFLSQIFLFLQKVYQTIPVGMM